VNLVWLPRLELAAELMVADDGGYLISTRALVQVEADFNFPPQILVVDAVMGGV